MQSNPLKEHQVEIFIKELTTSSSEEFSEILNYIRSFLPATLKDSEVIRIVQDIDTASTKQYIIDFFVDDSKLKDEKDYKYTVVQVVIEVVTSVEKEYHIISITTIINNGKEVSESIYRQDEEFKTNLAYGFRTVSAAEISENANIQNVLSYIK